MESQQTYPITLRGISYNEAGPKYMVRPHARHGGHQLYGVIYGGVDQVIDGVTYSLGPGQFVLIPPDAVRSPRCRDRAPGYMWAVFHNHRLDLSGLELRVMDVGTELRPCLEMLVKELRESPGANSEDMIRAMVTQLIIGFQRAELSKTGKRRPAQLTTAFHEELVERAELFMMRNLRRTLRRCDIAAAVSLSEPHMARVFREIRGMSPMTRLAEFRISRAKELLVSSSMPISDICFEVGYYSFSHFTKVFRRFVGATPSDYRRSGGRVYRRRK